MSVEIVFSYVAIKPIRAEHPVGSGVVVEYQPGDVIPAGEWGRAADNLVELGKAARLAVNVVMEENEVVIGGDGVIVAPVAAPKRTRKE